MVRREIEKHRTDPRSPRRQKRARDVSGKLRNLVLSVDDGCEADIPGRPNVTYLELAQSPKLSKYHNLSADTQDDHIIASMLDFREEYPECAVIAVAGDTELVLKARRNGFGYLYLADDYRLSDEPTAEQRQLRELERRVKILQSPSPELEVSFGGSADGTITLPAVTPMDDVISGYRREVLELLEDLSAYKFRSEEADASVELRDLKQLVAKTRSPIERKANVENDVIARITSGIHNLRIGAAHFDKGVLQPHKVFLEISGLAGLTFGGGTIIGEDADWYWAVRELDARLQQIERNIHDIRRTRQFKPLEMCLENMSGTTAEDLDIEIATSEGLHFLFSQLDLWVRPQDVFPYLPPSLDKRDEPEWELSAREPENPIRDSLKSLKPGENFCWNVGFIRVPGADKAVKLTVRILGRNLAVPVQVVFLVRSQ